MQRTASQFAAKIDDLNKQIKDKPVPPPRVPKFPNKAVRAEKE